MSKYPLFSVLGIEIEYMLVDKTTLNIAPKSDLILTALAGKLANEVPLGQIAASNELVLHVLELKNNGPANPQAPLAQYFQDTVLSLQPILDKHSLLLLPSAAHPWMNPLTETKRWTHNNDEIYQQFDTIFSCEGHGWSNLQTMHLNLPFANDEEFDCLHNAIRLLLPLIPALAASSPFLEGRYTGLKDSRLDYYGKNQQRIPSIAGQIIPEFIRSQKSYEDCILEPMYRDIKPFDPDGILQHEWLNSRGAIPKFFYSAIEIRITDTQECVNADIAIAKAMFFILKRWVKQSSRYLEKPFDTHKLKQLYDQTLRYGFEVLVTDQELLAQWQVPQRPSDCRTVWTHLIEQISSDLDQVSQELLENIIRQGSLSERLLNACGSEHSQANLKRVYRQLSDCLLTNQAFKPL